MSWRGAAFWITDKAQEWVAAADSETGQSADAVWAAEVLNDDLLRWSRWWLGLGAFVLAFIAAGVAGPLSKMLFFDSPGDTLAVLGILVVAVLALAVVTVVLWRLHRSGRQLARSLRWWLGLRADSVPSRGFAGWVAPRSALFDPAVFVRIATATVSGLVGILGFSLIGYSLAEDGQLLVTAVLWGLLGAACCLGQFGGVMRLVAGRADADPLWNRIRGR